MLTERERERLFDRIAGWCTAWAVGAATQVECDELGMADAQRLAAARARSPVSACSPTRRSSTATGTSSATNVPHVLRKIGADRSCLSVAAASILAKVTRDRLMRELSDNYPHWHFDSNKGYPCPWHKAALQGYGASAIHRRTWVFMDHYLPWPGHRVIRPEQPQLF